MTKPKGWSYSAGERRKNRVRVFEEPSGLIFVEYREREEGEERARRKRQSLGHRDRNKAMEQARLIAARLVAKPEREDGVTLGTLFDIYLAEVTPRKSGRKQEHDHNCVRLFLILWGRDRRASTLNLTDWNHYIDLRRSGQLAPKGKRTGPVGERQVGYDLAFLKAVLNWATMAGPSGECLLDRSPVRGYPLPRERNPARPILTDAKYRGMLAVAGKVHWRLAVALVLANETGHRISAICHLRWSDIDFEQRKIRWRAEHDKVGHEHVTPVSTAAIDALRKARAKTNTIGDSWVLPAMRRHGSPCSRYQLSHWFHEAAELGGVELPPRAGWHSLRRKFATELQDMALRDLSYLGGWKDPKTLLTLYQQPDENAMRDGLDRRRQYGPAELSLGSFSTDSLAKRMG